jgi:hypothetical protein
MAEAQMFTEASWGLSRLAIQLRAEGDAVAADKLVKSAADLEMLSPDLQKCWGGAFNNQSGREAIILEILAEVRPSIVIETGTFRGVTTEWFATNFLGPVVGCELEPLYLIQAQHRLEDFRNVKLSQSDSRAFLRETLASLPRDSRILLYLDAHWKDDLPLAEELELIVASGLQFVAIVDDFKVPLDSGYLYDDYGPGKSLELDLVPEKARVAKVFFPRIESSQETGEKKGVCILSTNLVRELNACALLRGDDWSAWRLAEVQDELARLKADTPPELPATSLDAGAFDHGGNWTADASGPLRKFLIEWELRMAKYLDENGANTRLGRQLVEERAKNLDLTRQIYRLQNPPEKVIGQLAEQTQFDRMTKALPKFNLDQIQALLSKLHNDLGSLAHSRALRMISMLTPKPMQTVSTLQDTVCQLKAILLGKS